MKKSRMSFSSEGVYTILHSDELAKYYRSGRSGTFTEGKRWVKAKELLVTARAAAEVVPVIFAPNAWELAYFAELDDVTIKEGKDGKWSSKVTVKNLTKIPPKKPIKTSLTVCSTGERLPRTHIRPYVIVHTPRFILARSPVGGGSK